MTLDLLSDKDTFDDTKDMMLTHETVSEESNLVRITLDTDPPSEA